MQGGRPARFSCEQGGGLSLTDGGLLGQALCHQGPAGAPGNSEAQARAAQQPGSHGQRLAGSCLRMEQLALEPGELPSGGRILTWGWASARGWPVTVLMLTEHSSN